MDELQKRIERDAENAKDAKERAEEKLKVYIRSTPTEFANDDTIFGRKRKSYESNEILSLKGVAEYSFHAMVEVMVETRDGVRRHQLWYVNKYINNNIILPKGGGDAINVLSWTHPGIQVALTENLGSFTDISDRRLTLVGVSPEARAKFTRVLPAIVGIYEPGGSVGEIELEPVEKGLKAVKLDMTPEQVKAFISKMNGIMFVTGAPGSGKTTVAMQRVRFLYDQQGLRQDHQNAVNYSPEATKVFLANPNLIEYTKSLLRDQLNISSEVVALVPDFVNQYLTDMWIYKHNARPQTKKDTPRIEERAREAFFSLCLASDLQRCWEYFEKQIAIRLSDAEQSSWCMNSGKFGPKVQIMSKELAEALSKRGKEWVNNSTKIGSPTVSILKMDRVFSHVRNEYEALRESYSNKKNRENFDDEFSKWLYYVYDPLDCIFAFFSDFTHEGKLRIKEGTGAKVDETIVVDNIFFDFKRRMYKKEEKVWLAWLLRFALPEEVKPENRFRRMPCALFPALVDENTCWTHIVIDEAQDLSVAEASLLCSFVDQRGALTISSDFHQIVSPVHGMQDANAFKYGCPILDRSTDSYFPFSKNMRQTKQISSFLRSFYYNTFKEPPPFVPNDQVQDIKPLLHICKTNEIPTRIRQMFSVLRKSRNIQTIALIQVNEDEDELVQIRSILEREGVPLASIWQPYSDDHVLVTTSVERIKGLEYDCCFVVGLDNVELSALKFSINRAYVALSRPSKRLAMFCERFPKILHGIDSSLFDVIK